MFASGVRRSWLAHATSSRRASKRRSMLPAISLNDAASSASSRGPALGRARVEVAARRAPRTRRGAGPAGARSTGRGTRPATTATVADAAATARIFTSSPMWNITQPESSTDGEREARPRGRRARRAGVGRSAASRSASASAEPDGERGQLRRASALRSWDEPVADAPDRLQVRGLDGSSSIFSRSRRTCTVTVPVSSAAS